MPVWSIQQGSIALIFQRYKGDQRPKFWIFILNTILMYISF